jgi:hypothetical protein
MSGREPKMFVDYVQAHEREWGGQTYPNRPRMEQVLRAAVVAFWIDSTIANGSRHIMTLHDDLTPIEDYFSKLVRRMSYAFPNRRLTILFQNGEELEIGVKVAFRPVPRNLSSG